MSTRVQIKKWGNSLALRIPKPFADNIGAREGTVVEVSVAAGRLVASPVRQPKIKLAGLLSKVTKANLHREVETGSSIGREAW